MPPVRYCRPEKPAPDRPKLKEGNPPMDTRTIGSLTVSVVGLGCNNFGMRIGRQETAAVVGAALDAGITLFDTADIYGGTKSEKHLGAALGARRDEIVLATKFGVPYEGHAGGASPDYIRTAVEDSLSRLGTDRIDLYQLHAPDSKTPIADTLGALGALVAEGKVREIGCSNFSAPMLEEAAGAVAEGAPSFVSVQNQYNALHREPEDAVLPLCDRTGLAFLPYFPLASGLLSGKYRAGEAPPEGTRLAAMGEAATSQLSEDRLATVAALQKLAESEGHTVLELAIAWLLSQHSVSSVIAGATKPEQVTANVAAASWRLSPEVLSQVDAIAPR
jgi:aryl-alcohol dehydrogenase-like predicted oxidoreductase